jgi:hypothetical protein
MGSADSMVGREGSGVRSVLLKGRGVLKYFTIRVSKVKVG